MSKGTGCDATLGGESACAGIYRCAAAESVDSSPRKGLSALANREVEMIEAALAESHGRISGPSGAAAKLGMPRQTLESKVRRLGIDKYLQKPQPSK